MWSQVSLTGPGWWEALLGGPEALRNYADRECGADRASGAWIFGRGSTDSFGSEAESQKWLQDMESSDWGEALSIPKNPSESGEGWGRQP